MIDINPLLLIDFYKACHGDLLPKNMIKSVSYYTPRRSRIKMWDQITFFGLQAFCKTYLIDYFNKYFFSKTREEVVNEYQRVLDNTFGKGIYNLERVGKLHDLGYLPIEIVALPEGTMVDMHVPIFGITNTHPDFVWLPQALESLISAEMWYPMITATVGHTYRTVVNRFYRETCDDTIAKSKALGNFDFRGDQGLDASLKAAGGWLLSFENTATVPSIPWMEKMYNCDCTKEKVGFGAISTEHFVMCSNSGLDTANNADYEYADIDPHRERIFIKKLLTQYYPNNSISCVCDSYDYWNVVNNILPTLKNEILNHNGCFLVRGDSGDCVKVVTETVFRLWDIFGGTINSKGYKVLNPHIKALYGDSITVQRAEQIYQILKDNGFAASNVALGVGSFSMHCIEEEGEMKVFTRDTVSSAIKAVYAEFKNDDGSITKMPIYKDPKTDKETGFSFKKSQKGCCSVFWRDKWNKRLTYEDGLTWDEACNDASNMLQPVFRDGKLLKEYTLDEIRQKLNNGSF